MSILNKSEAGTNHKSLGEFAQIHCLPVDKREKYYRFNVQDNVVCAFIYGLDGRTFQVSRIVYDCDCVKFLTPYPACAPMIIIDEGEERMFTKPGWYEICASDGEPLPKDFTVDWSNLTECQAKSALMEAHTAYLCQRDADAKIARLRQ